MFHGAQGEDPSITCHTAFFQETKQEQWGSLLHRSRKDIIQIQQPIPSESVSYLKCKRKLCQVNWEFNSVTFRRKLQEIFWSTYVVSGFRYIAELDNSYPEMPYKIARYGFLKPIPYGVMPCSGLIQGGGVQSCLSLMHHVLLIAMGSLIPSEWYLWKGVDVGPVTAGRWGQREGRRGERKNYGCYTK